MKTIQDYSLPVHKSFHQPDLLLGLPKAVFLLILLLTVGIVYLFGLIYGFIGIVLYIPCNLVSKNDPHLLEYALFSLFEIEHLEG
jgi:type IV secretory pathway VirB3-like protein